MSKTSQKSAKLARKKHTLETTVDGQCFLPRSQAQNV